MTAAPVPARFTVLLWFLKHALLSCVVLCWPQGCTDIHTDVCQGLTFLFSHISRRSVMVWCRAVSLRRIKKRHKASCISSQTDQCIPAGSRWWTVSFILVSDAWRGWLPKAGHASSNKKTHVIRKVPSFCNDEDSVMLWWRPSSCCAVLTYISGFRSLCNIDSRLIIRAPLLYL